MIKVKMSWIILCVISFSAMSEDDYGYSEHSASEFKFYVNKCNNDVPGLIARFATASSQDTAKFLVIEDGVTKGNDAAKKAFQNGLKLINMPPKADLDKCYGYISKYLNLQIESLSSKS